MESFVESYLTCPISGEIYEDPIIVHCCGATFSRSHLDTWLQKSRTCPNCRHKFTTFRTKYAVKNTAIISMIDHYNQQEKKSDEKYLSLKERLDRREQEKKEAAINKLIISSVFNAANINNESEWIVKPNKFGGTNFYYVLVHQDKYPTLTDSDLEFYKNNKELFHFFI